MLISILWIVWLSLTPIIDRDALRFHLSFSKLWAENDFLFFRKWFAYYDLNMLNLNYLYMLVFKLGLPAQATKIIHASFLLAGGYLIYKYFKEKYGFNWGAVSFVMYITVPVHQRLASEVYVDLGLLFFSTAATIYFLKWFESDFKNKKYLVISALGAGLGFGTKYNGMIIAFFLTLFTGLVLSRERKNDKAALKTMAVYGAIILIAASPWLIRNFINSGNPFFPLFGSVFSSSLTYSDVIAEGEFGETVNRIINGGENVFSLFLLPLRVFFQGKDNDLLRFDGVLNPFMFLFLVFIFFPGSKDEDLKKKTFYLLALFSVIYLTTLYSNDIRTRYFIPVLPLLVILNTFGLRNLKSLKTSRAWLFILCILCFAFNLNYGIERYSYLHMNDFMPFSKISADRYLSKYLQVYDISRYINQNTKKESVIYEAMTGGRGFYIERTFYCDTATLDRYLFELAKNGSPKEGYIKHFNSLPNSEYKATHLLMRPKNFIQTFIDINFDENDPENVENKKKIRGFVDFLNSIKILKHNDDVYLFEL
ncbi:MAG: glycosyltransferase family 39 protein [Candidatus Delongbacteria bacterium]|nr:glycosyltransferase family 39 protein [Candidatus Delongbacteria bacterium]